MAEPTDPWGGNPFLGKDNPYLQSAIDATLGDVVRNFNMTTRPALNTAMANSGSFGNAGLQQIDQEAQTQLQRNLGDTAARMRLADYNGQQGMYQWQKQFDTGNQQWEDQFNRGVFNDAFGQQQVGFQNGLQLLGMLSGMNANDLGTATSVRDRPLDLLGRFGNLGNSVGRGGSTQTTSGGRGDPLTGALGGAQLGSSFADWGRNQGWWGGGGDSGPFRPGGSGGSGFGWYAGNTGMGS